jgi:N-methylhydantoinase A
LGQNFELILELKNDRLDERSLARLLEAFHRKHKDAYGYDMRAQPVEIVNVRLVVTGKQRSTPQERAKLARGDLEHALIEKRKAWFFETGFAATPVYERDRLPADCRINGPAIIEQMDTTTIVPPAAKLRQDRKGYLHVELEAFERKRSAQWSAA